MAPHPRERKDMKRHARFLVGLLSGAIFCTTALANNCDNKMYRRYNPEKCQNYDTDSALSFASVAGVTSGAAALISGAIALFGTSSGDGNTNTPNERPSITLPITTTNRLVGNDIDNIQLASIMGTTEYARNTEQYNDILLAYSLARGYTGAGSTIAVFDSGKNTFHGGNVAYLAGTPIAPSATIQSYQVANRDGTFETYNTIGNTINTATTQGANIYNFSWSANLSATQIRDRNHLEHVTDTNFINSLTNAASKNDAIFVWAAGNDYNSQSSALSALPLHVTELSGHFVNVVAWDTDAGTLADFSNQCGITKDYCITAPGTNIESPKTDETLNGTSFATPIVSAAIAVLREAFPYMQATQITALLFETARDLGVAGVDEIYGHGMLDLERATRPVGTELVPLADGTTTTLRSATVTGTMAHNIKSANIKFAFIDSYGRAFETNMNDNIRIKNRGLGFERLRNTQNNPSVKFGNLEFGFKNTDLLKSNGFLATDTQNTITYLGWGDEFSINNTKLFYSATFGTMNPTPSAESMINNFSDTYTASISVGAKYNDFTFSVGTPDTIINGNMYLNTPTGRSANGDYKFTNQTIDMTSRPSVEFTASYKSITLGFVDNPYGTDEIYMLTKTKLQF